MSKRILGIVGSYRKGGIVDQLVSEALAGAQASGASTHKLYLLDEDLAFCTNCRTCAQEPGTETGRCVHHDSMDHILAQWKDSDALVLGAPVNFYNVNALTRRFIERLAVFVHWPWGQPGPRMRQATQNRQALLITSAAMPALLGRVFTGAPRALAMAARTMGARPIGCLFAGLSAQTRDQRPTDRTLRRARAAGARLALG